MSEFCIHISLKQNRYVVTPAIVLGSEAHYSRCVFHVALRRPMFNELVNCGALAEHSGNALTSSLSELGGRRQHAVAYHFAQDDLV